MPGWLLFPCLWFLNVQVHFRMWHVLHVLYSSITLLRYINIDGIFHGSISILMEVLGTIHLSPLVHKGSTQDLGPYLSTRFFYSTIRGWWNPTRSSSSRDTTRATCLSSPPLLPWLDSPLLLSTCTWMHSPWVTTSGCAGNSCSVVPSNRVANGLVLDGQGQLGGGGGERETQASWQETRGKSLVLRKQAAIRGG